MLENKQTNWFLVSVGFCVAVAAGCGDDDKQTLSAADCAGVNASGSLALSTSTLSEGATDIELSGPFEFEFSDDVIADSASASTIIVEGAKGAVAANVMTTGKKVVFTPQQPLSMAAQYKVTLTSDIKSNGCAALSEPVVMNFRTRDGAWGETEEVDAQNGANLFDRSIEVHIDARRISTILWNYYTSGGPSKDYVLKASRTGAEGWDVQTLDTNPDSISSADLSGDEDGRVHSIWTKQVAADDYRVYTSRVDESVWTSKVQMGGDVRNTSPSLYNDGTGIFYSLWLSPNKTLQWAKYTGVEAWNTLTPIFTNKSFGDWRLGVNASGNAVLGWSEGIPNTSSRNLLSKRFVAEAWEADDTLLDAYVTEARATNYTLSLDAQGRAISVWSDEDTDGYFAIFSSVLDPAMNAWSAPMVIGSLPQYDAYEFSAAHLPDGRALVVFYLNSSLHEPNVTLYAVYFDGQTWHEQKFITDLMNPDTFTICGVTLDEQNNAIAAWTNNSALYAARYTASNASWAPAQQLVDKEVRGCDLNANKQGYGTLAWYEVVRNTSNERVGNRVRARHFR